MKQTDPQKQELLGTDTAAAQITERQESLFLQPVKSLLKMGIVSCEGEFAAGDVVRICDRNGTGFAQGITRHAHAEIDNGSAGKVVVHRDDLVIL